MAQNHWFQAEIHATLVLFFEEIFYWVPHVASEKLHHAIGIRWVFYGEFVLLINMWDNQSIDIQIKLVKESRK